MRSPPGLPQPIACGRADPRGARRSCARHYGFARDDALVIPNGIDLAAYRPAAKRRVVLAAGRMWDAAKNLALARQVAARLAWPIEIAGRRRPIPRAAPRAAQAADCIGVPEPGRNGGASRPRRDLRAARPLRALRARYPRSGGEPAAPWCSAIFRRCAKTGRARRFLSPPGDAAAVAHRIARLDRRRGRSRAVRHAAQQRARGIFARARWRPHYAALYREMAGGSAEREVA